MIIKPIKTKADYEKGMQRLEKIFDSKPNTPLGDEAEVLSMLIENYENQHYAIDAPDPIEAIKIRMEEMNIKQSDLANIIGSKSRVSEVLNKRRKLTVDMIRNLTGVLKLSATVLVQDYRLKN
ncbi:MAG: helix-turn-helix domain-containing protein [Bacteroidia bacterium]